MHLPAFYMDNMRAWFNLKITQIKSRPQLPTHYFTNRVCRTLIIIEGVQWIIFVTLFFSEFHPIDL